MHFFLSALGKDAGVRNLLNTRPDLEGVEKAAVFWGVDTIILFFGVTNRGRFFLCFVLFKERLDFFSLRHLLSSGGFFFFVDVDVNQGLWLLLHVGLSRGVVIIH